MKLPTFKEAQENFYLGVPTPLELFIYHFEPVEEKDAAGWRSMLQAALEDYADQLPGEMDEVPYAGDETMPLPLDKEPE